MELHANPVEVVHGILLESYTPEDLKKILTGYKRIEQFKHPDFSLKELKKYLKKYIENSVKLKIKDRICE